MRSSYYYCFSCNKTYEVCYNFWERPPKTCNCELKKDTIGRIGADEYEMRRPREMTIPKSYDYEDSKEED